MAQRSYFPLQRSILYYYNLLKCSISNWHFFFFLQIVCTFLVLHRFPSLLLMFHNFQITGQNNLIVLIISITLKKKHIQMIENVQQDVNTKTDSKKQREWSWMERVIEKLKLKLHLFVKTWWLISSAQIQNKAVVAAAAIVTPLLRI